MDSHLIVSGSFDLIIREKGIIKERIQEHNIVVDSGLSLIAHLVSGDATPVTKIGFGTSNLSASRADIGLDNIYTKDILSYTFPQPGHVCFNWVLEEQECNDMEIFEFGLLTSGNTLFSRKVREQAIYKTSDLSLDGNWTLIFERI